MLDLTKDVKYVKGVGPNRVKLLNKIGIYNLGDLITYYPRDYEDRSKPRMIQNLVNGEDSLIKAVAVSRVVEIRLKNRMCMYKLVVQDETAICRRINRNYSSCIIFSINIIKNRRTHLKFSHSNICFSKKIISFSYYKFIENGLEMVDGNLEESMPEYILDNYNLLEIS